MLTHRARKRLNNAIEVSHRPTRKRAKTMGRFNSPQQAQRSLSFHDQIDALYRPAAIYSLQHHTDMPDATISSFGLIGQEK